MRKAVLIPLGALKIKVQLFCADAHCMGPGKAELLEAIGREGSISAAGRAMGMSYRKCRVLVDRMNRTFAQALVETRFNGASGQGARLTPLGREVLGGFRDLERRVRQAAAESEARLFLLARLRAEPLAAQRDAGLADLGDT
jgi:molybdate transport system regulatory protein